MVTRPEADDACKPNLTPSPDGTAVALTTSGVAVNVPSDHTVTPFAVIFATFALTKVGIVTVPVTELQRRHSLVQG